MFEREVLLWKQKTFKNTGINNLDEGEKRRSAVPRLLHNIIWKLERRGREKRGEIKHQRYNFIEKKKKAKKSLLGAGDVVRSTSSSRRGLVLSSQHLNT